MDLKKIMALAMIAFLAFPNLTMVRADGLEDGAGLADVIERARLYLSKVRNSAETLADEYSTDPDHMIHGYLNEIYELLGSEILLETIGEIGDGNESRIVIPMPDGFTLGDLETLSWSVNTIYGYPPHVDITLDVDEDGVVDPEDILTAEMAVNQGMTIAYIAANLPYDWVKTFQLTSTGGHDLIDGDTVFWVTKMGSGDLNAPSSTLEHWKTSTVDNDPETEMGISIPNSTTPVLKLEIEVDNWVVQSEAYVDDIEINGVPYGQVKYYLDQASAYLDEGDINSTARNLAAARNILGRVKGLLNSMVKAHKVTRIERFMEQVRHRIKGILDKVERLSGRFSEGRVNKAKASMGFILGNMPQIGDNPSDGDVNDAIDNLEDTIEEINEALGTLDGDTSTILEAMDRIEAKIWVLKASAERLSKKGYDTDAVVDELENADLLLQGILDSLKDDDTEEAENLLKQAGDLVSEASKNIRRIRNQNKGTKGKGKG